MIKFNYKHAIIIILLLALILVSSFYHHYIISYLHQTTGTLLNFFEQQPQTGLLFCFLSALCESLPLIGTVVPGMLTMTISGILIGNNSLSLPSAMSLIILGAYLGDWIGYLTGYLYQDKILSTWPFKKQKKFIDYCISFFKKHGGKSIIIGRFIGPVRSTIPLFGGVLGLNPFLFAFVGLVSAILWSIAYTAPGIFLGKLAMELPATAMIKITTFGIIGILLTCGVGWMITRIRLRLIHVIRNTSCIIWRRLNTPIGKQNWICSQLGSKNNKQDHTPLYCLLVSLLFLLAFLVTLVNVKYQTALLQFNPNVHHFMQSLYNNGWRNIAIVITAFGFYKLLLISSGLTLVLLFIFKQKREYLSFAVTLVISVAAIALVKHLSHSARPLGIWHVKSESSFPSGHTTMATVFYGCLAFYSAQWFPRLKNALYTVATVIITLVAASRLYLSAHWLTDIIGALLLGCTLMYFNRFLYSRNGINESPTPPKRSWFLSISVFTLTPTLFYITHTFSQQQQNYTLVTPTQTLTQHQWWVNTSKYTPTYRLSRWGYPQQPLNLQWQGSLDTIKDQFKALGFHDNFSAPLVSWTFKHHTPMLFMSKTYKEDQAILDVRLWKSFITINHRHNKPLWIGSINFHTKKTALDIFSQYRDIHFEYKNQTPTHWLHQAIITQWQSKIVRSQTTNYIAQQTNWNKSILLVTHSKTPL